MSTIDTLTLIHSDLTDDLQSILETLWAFVPARVLSCAIEAGLLEAFGDGGREVLSVADVAHRIGWSLRPTRVALGLLSKVGVIRLVGDSVALTPKGIKWFSHGSSFYLPHYFDRCKRLELAYRDLSDVLRTDRPNQTMLAHTKAAFGLDSSATKDFVLTMHAAASEFGPAVVANVKSLVSQDRQLRVLDVGCGPATLSILLATAFPLARINAFDLPGVADLAKAYIAEISMDKTISVTTADWNEWSWENGTHDLVLLSQVLHEATPHEAHELFLSASLAVRTGGFLVVVIVGDATVPGGDNLHRLFAMNMLVETGGDNTTHEWMHQMELESGLKRVRFTAIRGGRSLWIGQKG